MKLFTEKQVIKAIKLARECNSDCWGIDFYNGTTAEILDLLTPIELPSDEDMDKEAESISKGYKALGFYNEDYSARSILV